MANRLTLNSLNARMDTIEAKLDNLIEALNRKPASGQGNPQPTVEKVAYTKANGETVMATPAQAKAWDDFKAHAGDRKESFEQMKATWADKREAYKPSKELVKAIQTNRASVTLAVANTYGFVGTKQDLQALKNELCK